MGNNQTSLTADDYIESHFSSEYKDLIPNCGNLQVIKFNNDPKNLYTIKVLNQAKYDNIIFDTKKLQKRLKDKTSNQASLVFVFNSKVDKTCFDMIFEYSQYNLAGYLEHGPLKINEYYNLLEKIIATGKEKEKKLEHFVNVDKKSILIVNGDFKFLNPYMCESYFNDVLTIYLTKGSHADSYHQNKIKENVTEFGRLLLSCVYNKHIDHYNDSYELDLDLKKLSELQDFDSTLKAMIKRMCRYSFGATFIDLENYYESLKFDKIPEEAPVTKKVNETPQFHGHENQDDKKFSKKTEAAHQTETTENNFAEKKYQIKSKKPVKKILYQWNNDEKKHDVVHEYEDGTRSILDENSSVDSKQSEIKSTKSKKSKKSAIIDRLDKLKQKLASKDFNEGTSLSEDVENCSNEKQAKEVSAPHIQNDFLQIVVSSPGESKQKDIILFQKDFSHLKNEVPRSKSNYYTSKSGKRIPMHTGKSPRRSSQDYSINKSNNHHPKTSYSQHHINTGQPASSNYKKSSSRSRDRK